MKIARDSPDGPRQQNLRSSKKLSANAREFIDRATVFARIHDNSASAWVFGGQGILLATLEPQQTQQSAIDVVLKYLRGHSVDEADSQRKLKEILASRFLDAAAISRLTKTRTPMINTDWNRWIEFATPRYNADMIDWYAINSDRLASMKSR
jgi:hypothetical protein